MASLKDNADIVRRRIILKFRTVKDKNKPLFIASICVMVVGIAGMIGGAVYAVKGAETYKEAKQVGQEQSVQVEKNDEKQENMQSQEEVNETKPQEQQQTEEQKEQTEEEQKENPIVEIDKRLDLEVADDFKMLLTGKYINENDTVMRGVYVTSDKDVDYNSYSGKKIFTILKADNTQRVIVTDINNGAIVDGTIFDVACDYSNSENINNYSEFEKQAINQNADDNTSVLFRVEKAGTLSKTGMIYTTTLKTYKLSIVDNDYATLNLEAGKEWSFVGQEPLTKKNAITQAISMCGEAEKTIEK